MIKEIDRLFSQIRKSKLPNFDSLVFEIDMSDENISKSLPLRDDNTDFKKLEEKLSPSFIKFIQKVSNGLHLEIGNALTILPVGKGNSDFWTDVLSLTTDILEEIEDLESQDFIFFAVSGVDTEMFAFYTATKFENGEYPIVWFNPSTLDDDHFVLLNSSFDKFLTIQYYLLKATEYGETFDTYEEAEKASSDKIMMEQDEQNWQNFQTKLYDTFDPHIPKPNDDLYQSAMNFTKLTEVIELTKNALTSQKRI